ncbi:MAG: hypothetical protein ABSD72_09495 [Terracidiphilus sp.]
MKTILRLGVLSMALLALASGASASTITLNSGNGSGSSDANGALEFLGTSALPLNEQGPYPTAALSASLSPTTQSSSQTSYDTLAAGVWANAITGTSWVANTSLAGPGCAGSQCDANAFYYYETTFNVAGGAAPNSGSISAMADDTAEVLLNGVIVVPFGAIGSDSHCSDGGLNCSAIDTISLSGIPLNAGTNTLEIIDAQTGGSAAGVDFSANFTDATQVPELSSLVLLGTGLLGLAYALYRKGSLDLHE